MGKAMFSPWMSVGGMELAAHTHTVCVTASKIQAYFLPPIVVESQALISKITVRT